MNKYYKYLQIKHTYGKINCLTLIELIYKEKLKIDMSETWQRAGRHDGTSQVDKKWFLKYTIESVKKELQHWIYVSITDIKEYDIVIFVSKKMRPLHFGMYIGDNKYIHLPENSNCHISELNLKERELLFGVYRHPKLV